MHNVFQVLLLLAIILCVGTRPEPLYQVFVFAIPSASAFIRIMVKRTVEKNNKPKWRDTGDYTNTSKRQQRDTVSYLQYEADFQLRAIGGYLRRHQLCPPNKGSLLTLGLWVCYD